MGPKTPVTEGEFFRQPLREQINLKHPLVRRTDLIDWDRLGWAWRGDECEFRLAPRAAGDFTAPDRGSALLAARVRPARRRRCVAMTRESVLAGFHRRDVLAD
jgi:hypothetical protein